jgi:hypothetical protein
MLNVSLNVVLPVVSGGIPGTLEWPALGAVLAWLLILCLLGASVGLLRDYRRASSVPPDEHADEPADIPIHLPPKHLKAA